MNTHLTPAAFLELLAAGAAGDEASSMIAQDAHEERGLLAFVPDYEPTPDDPERPGDPLRDIVVITRMVDLMKANPEHAVGRSGWSRALLASILFLHYPRHPWPMVERCETFEGASSDPHEAFVDFVEVHPDAIVFAVLEYAVRCEEFDRTQPGYWIRNARPPEWMPYLMGPSREFARARQQELYNRLRGYSRDVIRTCRRIVDRLPHETRVRELEYLRRNHRDPIRGVRADVVIEDELAMFTDDVTFE